MSSCCSTSKPEPTLPSSDDGKLNTSRNSGSCCGGGAVAEPDAGLPSISATEFKIEGMDCANCAATIVKAVDGLDGVAQAKVSLSREMLSVELSDDTDTAMLMGAVKSLGFGIAPVSDVADKPTRPWWDTTKTRHLGISIVASLVALIIAQLYPASEPVVLTAVAAFAIYPIAKKAITAARLGSVFTIQLLMTIAAIGAVIIGEQLEALLVILLFMVGEFLEGFAAEKARSGIKALGKLLPADAWLIDGDGTRKVAANSLQIGELVMVRPGDRVPADGEVIDGQSSLDESPVTGESVPVTKGIGDPLFAGTVNHDAALRVRVTEAAENNTIARIIKMVEEAQDAKAPTERFIERFSRIYMPIVIALAVAVAILPPLMGLGDWLTWTYRALALLLIGCPCALVISVPAAIAASLSTGARHGILIKGGAVMEEIAKTTQAVFDKTGTLTEGTPKVTEIVSFGMSEDALLSIALGVEQGSSHPLAEAICKTAKAKGATPEVFETISIVPGKGMQADDVFIGAPRYAAERATLGRDILQQIETLEHQGKTVTVVTRGADVLGMIALRDEPRATTKAGIASLAAHGVTSVMMTGDNARTGQAIGEQLGIAVEAEMLPEDKAARVRARAQDGHVLMVGDGVNDAPALAEAHVGVAIGSGTDVAMEAADAALMRNDIGDVARMVDLARGTMRNVRQNVIIALGLKAVFLVTTVTGLSGLWMAVLADSGATVLVTLNAMRLLGYLGKPSKQNSDDNDQAPDPGFGVMDPVRP